MPMVYEVLEWILILIAMMGMLLIMGAKYDSWMDYGIVAICTLACILAAWWLFGHEVIYLAR